MCPYSWCNTIMRFFWFFTNHFRPKIVQSSMQNTNPKTEKNIVQEKRKRKKNRYYYLQTREGKGQCNGRRKYKSFMFSLKMKIKIYIQITRNVSIAQAYKQCVSITL